jgi:hypothetical protein
MIKLRYLQQEESKMYQGILEIDGNKIIQSDRSLTGIIFTMDALRQEYKNRVRDISIYEGGDTISDYKMIASLRII